MIQGVFQPNKTRDITGLRFNNLGLPYHTLYDRLYRLGWPIEKALTTPVRRSA